MTGDTGGREETRQALMNAVDQLATRPKLTVTEVARQAGYSRATANRYPEVLEYLKEVKANSPEAQVAELRKEIKSLKREHAAEVERLKRASDQYAQRIQVLSVAYERAVADARRTDVVEMDSRRTRKD